VKICYLAYSEEFLAPDGGFRHIYSICSQLAKDGDEIYLFTKGLGKNIRNKRISIINGRFYVYQIDFPISPFLIGVLSFLKRFPRMVIDLIKTIKKEQIDIIHQRFWIPIGAGIFIAKLLGIPYVLDVNAPFVEEVFYKKRIHWLYKIWRKAVFKAADAIITTTSVLRNIVARETKKEKIFVVRQVLDLNDLR
jgi:glycosyltransferase involved in cell wall biosynthesis